MSDIDIYWARTFHEEDTACAKVLRQEHAWHVEGQQGGQGGCWGMNSGVGIGGGGASKNMRQRLGFVVPCRLQKRFCILHSLRQKISGWF